MLFFSNILNLYILLIKNLEKIDPATILHFERNIQYTLKYKTQGQNYRTNKCILITDSALITYALEFSSSSLGKFGNNTSVQRNPKCMHIQMWRCFRKYICSIFDKYLLVPIYRT